jgi:deoxyribodipyrimidine photolyase-related protein
LFADQLGPHFLDDPEQRVLLVVARTVFRRRRYHRQKAHLVLSALRHRAAELGERAELVEAERYRDVVGGEPLEVCHPTSRVARDFVRALPDVTVLPPRGFVTAPADFVAWADGRTQLRMEYFYRAFLHRNRGRLAGNHPDGSTPGLGRLDDIDDVAHSEAHRRSY